MISQMADSQHTTRVQTVKVDMARRRTEVGLPRRSPITKASMNVHPWPALNSSPSGQSQPINTNFHHARIAYHTDHGTESMHLFLAASCKSRDSTSSKGPAPALALGVRPQRLTPPSPTGIYLTALPHVPSRVNHVSSRHSGGRIPTIASFIRNAASRQPLRRHHAV
jgi:hypothetical protein